MRSLVALIQDTPTDSVQDLLATRDIAASFRATVVEARANPPAAGTALIILVARERNADCEIEFLRWMRMRQAHTPILFVACLGSEELAIRAFRGGATDYFQGSARTELRQSVEHHLHNSPEVTPDLPGLIGQTSPIEDLRKAVLRTAPTASTVLITGETGTGKDLVAQLVHRHSRRADRNFVGLNCAAIPESLLESELFGYERGAFTGASASVPGKLQQAHGGTIFLDEIGDMNPTVQAKILRALDTRQVYPLGARTGVQVDIRILAATNQELESLIQQGRFRADLYYRLNVLRIRVPPLREHKADIPLLLAHYAREFRRDDGRGPARFREDTMKILTEHDWPGNVRELKNVIEAALVHGGDTIVPDDLPLEVRISRQGGKPSEMAALVAALSEANWNKSRAAAKLQWSRMTLYRKMAKYEMRAPSVNAGR